MGLNQASTAMQSNPGGSRFDPQYGCCLRDGQAVDGNQLDEGPVAFLER